MLKTWNTIIKFSLYREGSRYQFLRFEWMLMIGMCSGRLEEANGMNIRAWIVLKSCFQFWVYGENFQCCNGVFWAAASVWALGFSSGICSEAIRLRKSIKSLVIHCLNIWFFFHYVSYLFHVHLIQLASNQAKSFHVGMCTNYWA